MRRGAILLALLVLAPVLPLPQAPSGNAQAQSDGFCNVPCPWWNPEWHMRVPILVEPRIDDAVLGGTVSLAGDKVRNWPALVEVDFTRALREASDNGFGWPQDSQGNLASFTFDPASVRVVEYDRIRGCPLVREVSDGSLRCAGGQELTTRRDTQLLAASFTTGLFLNLRQGDPTYHAERNAVGTVQFTLRGETTTARLFFVYFDILQNNAGQPKPRATYRAEDSGLIDGAHFIRSGTDILGLAPGTQATGPGVLMAQALYDNTTISISKYTTPSAAPAEMVRGNVNALANSVNAQHGTCPTASGYRGTVCLDVPQGERFFFRVQANRPVIVGLMPLNNDLGPTWVPSKDGSVSGTQFDFRALASGDDSSLPIPLMLISPNGPASVTVAAMDRPPSVLCDNTNFFSATVEGATETCVVAGAAYRITSNRRILVLQSATGNDFGFNLMGVHGNPWADDLVGWVHNDLTLLRASDAYTEVKSAARIGSAPILSDVEVPAGAPLYSFGGEYGTIGELWRVNAKDGAPLWARAGERGIVPLAGKDAMHYVVSIQPARQRSGDAVVSDNDAAQTRIVVMGLYDTTRVVVTNLDGTGGPVVNATIGLHQWIDAKGSVPEIPYGHYRIEASKPVAVFLYGPGRQNDDPPFSTYYQAKMAPPQQTQGEGEFHGYAVGWEDKVKTAAVAPGERARLKLTLINLGRGLGGEPLLDDIGLAKEVARPANASIPGIEGSTDLSSVLEAQVPSYQRRDITLSVTVPADAPTGAVYQVNVTATSRGNPAFKDIARVVITVQIRHEFELRFVETNGTALQKIIKPDAATCIDVEARNVGTGDVVIRFQMTPTKKSPSAVGFDPRFLPHVQGVCEPTGAPLVDEDGQGLGFLTLRRGEARLLTLYVRAPADTRPLPLELEVQGTALEDASVRQQLSAVIFTNVEAKVALTALDEAKLILPGGNATFRLRIENVGDVETPVEYGTTGLLPLGWKLAFHGAPPLLRGRGSVDAEGKPLDVGDFVVNVTASREAPVAMVVPINVLATSAIIVDTGDTARAFKQSDGAKVTATVGNNFTLEQPELLPLTINPGDPFGLAFDLRSVANGNFTLRVLQGALPRNWTLSIDAPTGPVVVERGDRVAVRANVTPEVATKAGLYEVGLALVTQDAFTQGAQFRNTTIQVRSTVEFRVEPEVSDVLLAPGGERTLGLRVVNTGNLPVELRLGALAPPGYGAQLPEGSRVALQPGEEARRTLVVRAPDQAAEAPVTLRITGLDDTSNKQKEFPITLRTARLDLVVGSVVLSTPNPKVGQPAVVVATVQNRGTVPANNVALALIVNGVGVRNDTLRTLPPGEPRAITMSWTVDEAPRDIVVIIDADNKYAEADEDNNQGRVERDLAVPGPGAWAALGAAGLALALRGTARHKPPRRGAGRDG